MSPSRSRRWLRLVAQLLATSTFAYCGAKGSPQPPLSESPAIADAGTDAGAP